MIFQKRLKELRKERSLTQSELGKILNYGPSAVSNYEHGSNAPSYADLIKIANYFEVSLDFLLAVTDIRIPAYSIFSNKYNQDIFDVLEKLTDEQRSKVLDFAIFTEKEDDDSDYYSSNKSNSNFQYVAQERKDLE